MAPGGSISGTVSTDAGQPIEAARVVVDFQDGTSFDLNVEEGRYASAWSHGSWRGSVVKASAPGRQGAQASIGWDQWVCHFQLAPEDAPPASSRAHCVKGDQ
jgi:hypothetical protein